MKKADNFDVKKWLTENKITTQSRLNENEEFDSDFPSLDYNTITNFIKSKGYKITSDYYDGGFDVNDGEYFVGVFDDHIAVTGDDGQVKDIPFNESRLNENEGLVAKISALPNHHIATNAEDATLVVGNYAVVFYEDSIDGGEDNYVVWDNTIDQDEIGSYDDEPEFESNDPAEVAAFLQKNESLNEDKSSKPLRIGSTITPDMWKPEQQVLGDWKATPFFYKMKWTIVKIAKDYVTDEDDIKELVVSLDSKDYEDVVPLVDLNNALKKEYQIKK
jgi:hypothetical protein